MYYYRTNMVKSLLFLFSLYLYLTFARQSICLLFCIFDCTIHFHFSIIVSEKVSEIFVFFLIVL